MLGVLRERRGTCRTKRALLKLLAMEQQIEIALVVEIYEMIKHNRPRPEACSQNIRLRACRRRIATRWNAFEPM